MGATECILYIMAYHLLFFISFWILIGKIGQLALDEMERKFGSISYAYDLENDMFSIFIGPLIIILLVIHCLCFKINSIGKYLDDKLWNFSIKMHNKKMERERQRTQGWDL